ncbi:MAG: quinolinate synthase NadA, partial [Bacteroidia bacterium]
MNTFEEINLKGFAEEEIDPSLDLFDEIEKLKKEKN